MSAKNQIPPLPGQMSLVAHIAKVFGSRPVNTRQFNAIIAAADNILAEFGRASVPATPDMGLTRWLASDDTGLSSKYMASVLAERPWSQPVNHPHDADDFGRCYRLLQAVPELRSNSMRLASCPAPWPALHREWLRLEKLYEAALTAADQTAAWSFFYSEIRALLK